MKKIIVYGSKYGTTKRYAIELSNKTGIKVISYDKARDLSTYDTIVYLGGLYAGGVLGLSKTIKLLPENSKQTVIIVTVGLADTKDSVNTDKIKSSIRKQIPKDIYDKAKKFHLRGGIDYQKLNLKHKIMMKLLYNKVKKIPLEKQTAETKAMIDTYNQKVDFVDFNSLKDIIEILS
ncbi:flavodoxin domain-containing protein [Tissierellaceae bacterium HCP3S3_D8]